MTTNKTNVQKPATNHSQTAVAPLQDGMILLATICQKPEERPKGWASPEALQASAQSLSKPAAEYVQLYKAYTEKGTAIAIQIYYFWLQYESANPTKNQLDWIRTYFDPKCPEKQADANKGNAAYRAIVQYLFRGARVAIEAFRTKQQRQLTAQKNQKALAAASQEIEKTGAIQPTTKQTIINTMEAAETQGMAIPAEDKKMLSEILSGGAIDTKKLESVSESIGKALTTAATQEPAMVAANTGAPKAGSKRTPAAVAIAHMKHTLLKGGVEAVLMHTTIDKGVKQLFEALGRKDADTVTKLANDELSEMLTGIKKTEGTLVLEVPATTTNVTPAVEAPAA